MADPRLFRLRCVFAKKGRLAMLSHLELCRALERAVRRARLPYAVSQGFSPHMRIAFGAALPVGVGGDCEFFDLFLTDYVAPQKALSALRETIADDLMVASCGYIEHSAPAASVAFPLCTYRAVLSEEPAGFAVAPRVTVVRKKKEKTLEVADFLRGDVQLEGNAVTFVLEAKPTGSLRPDVFVKACLEETVAAGKASSGLRALSITRVAQEGPDGTSVR